jgi:Xaa-Pro aminopeptidase
MPPPCWPELAHHCPPPPPPPSGYYEDGAFGIRIENVMVAVPADTTNRWGGKTYLRFDSVTVAPITTRLVEPALLSPAEVTWLNAYNASVRARLAPLLPGWALEYLHRETAPL